MPKTLKIKLTKTSVEKLPYADKGKQVDYLDSDLDGFGIRVSATGKKYFVRRLIGKKRVRVMIGSHPIKTAEDARGEARVKLGVMESGVDPNEVKREKIRQVTKQAEEEQRQSITLEKAFTVYLDKRKLKPNTVTLYRRLFDLYLSDWLKLPISSITASLVNQRHSDIATNKRQRPAFKKTVVPGKKDGTNKPVLAKVDLAEPKRREASADGTMRVLRAVLNYTFGDDEETGVTRVNPVRTLSRKKSWYKVGRRRTLIKNSDLPAWHKAVMAMDNAVARDYFLFVLHTGLRRNEAAGLQWQQVDFNERCFSIPDTKNNEPLILPLTDYLYKLFKDRKESLKVKLIDAKAAIKESRMSPDTLTAKQRQTLLNRMARAESRLNSLYVFPGEGETGHFVEPKRSIDIITAATGIIFSCHDLRRTFATIAESLNLSGYTVKALMNHKQQIGDVTGGYIIINVDRLREPLQRITDAIQDRIQKQYGQVVQMQVGDA